MFSKTEPLNIKVLPSHKRALEALARLEGETMSVVLRQLIRQSALEKGVWLNIEEKKGDENVKSTR